ncbi:glycosyltransferase family 2 protein [Streptococcus caballi]|uniref:glycosyltransferase family 2 protein n=1 Tax=Streptococcus caballi TaxID=439220 RepID=UPI000368561C|nr:glycosyltransferase [Streptococcus caballi]
MTPLISVIIPIYNVENYLARCLDSVVNQTYANLEIILVNDGTPDGSVAIAEAYQEKDRRIKLIHQENAGLSEARNTGVAAATGDYIAFLDSDDWLELDAYEYLLQLLIAHDADVSIGGIRRTERVVSETSSGNQVEVLTQKEYAQRYFKIGSQEIHYYVWNKLYRRDVVVDVKQPKGLYAEDVPSTFMYILNTSKVVISDKVVYNYFVNLDGLSAKFSNHHFDVLKGWDMVVAQAGQSGDLDYQNWAIFNRKRANFALLTELALSENYSHVMVGNATIVEELAKAIRKDCLTLLKGPMPLNRKPLVLAFALNYRFTAGALNKLLQLKRKG